MPNIVATRELGDGKGSVRIKLEDGSELDAWTPELEKLRKAIEGKETPPIPNGWALRDNKQGTGKVLLPPREGGGGGFRNTKEAFELEAKSRREWQTLEEDRKDRRTAIMTAFESSPDEGADIGTILDVAGRIYGWLKEPK